MAARQAGVADPVFKDQTELAARVEAAMWDAQYPPLSRSWGRQLPKPSSKAGAARSAPSALSAASSPTTSHLRVPRVDHSSGAYDIRLMPA
jgi:hypothetical protein